MPVPSYLISICVGVLEEWFVSERCSVISEPSYLDICSKEFEDTEKFLQTAEEILFKYPLKFYKVIVLPPSFAYGGMENPVTTFVTPSIVIGDKSAINVVCHEIAHSWTGNLVTNSSWEDFWLNEGFTRYLEAKMMKRLNGDSHFLYQLRESYLVMEKIVKDGAKGGASVLVP